MKNQKKQNQFIKENTFFNFHKLTEIKTFKDEKGNVLISNKLTNLKQKSLEFDVKYKTKNNIKHYPAAIKEWSDNKYTYNKNTNRIDLSLDNKLSMLIRSYFNSYSRKLENKLSILRNNTNIKNLIYKWILETFTLLVLTVMLLVIIQLFLTITILVTIYMDYTPITEQTFIVYLLHICYQESYNFYLLFKLEELYIFIYNFFTLSNLKHLFNKSIRHTYKVLLGSVIFKIILTVFFFVVGCIGLSVETVQFYVTCLIISCIAYSIIKSDKKTKTAIITGIKLTIITIFWAIVNKCLGLLDTSLFVASYLYHTHNFYNSGDIGFSLLLSDLLRPLNLHSESIHDLEGLPEHTGPYGPILVCEHSSPRHFYKVRDICAIDIHDPQGYHQNNPGVQNPNYISDSSGLTCNNWHLRDCIDLCNRLCDLPGKDQMLVKKMFIKEGYLHKFNNLSEYYFGITPKEHYNYLLNENYLANIEYNTLAKGESYFLERYGYLNVQPIDDTFENSFELLRKKYLSDNVIDSLERLENVYNNYYDQRAPALDTWQKPDCLINNYYDNCVVYSEIVREKIYTSLKILKNYYTIKYINSNGINLDNLTHTEYENILKAITGHCKKEYKQFYDLLGKYISSHYENKTEEELNYLFHVQTEIALTPKIWYYDCNESTYQQLLNERFPSVNDKAFAPFTRVVGSYASNIKFEWNGFTSFLLGHNNPLLLHETRSPYFHKPVVVTIGGDLYEPKKYYSDDKNSILSKIPRYSYKKKMYYSHDPQPVLNGICLNEDYISSELD